MAKFIIEPHFRLQEWVAEEKGYFLAEGLDYEFRELIRSTEGQHHNKVNEGAFQSIEKGREADVSCACHWTVNVAASNGHTKLYADAYSVAPSGIFVAADSAVRQVRKNELVVYVENAGDFEIPFSAIKDAEAEKVILDSAKLDPRLKEAIRRAHSGEDPRIP